MRCERQKGRKVAVVAEEFGQTKEVERSRVRSGKEPEAREAACVAVFIRPNMASAGNARGLQGPRKLQRVAYSAILGGKVRATVPEHCEAGREILYFVC